MTRYGNQGGDSGISAYEIQEDGIIVQFTNGGQYLYTNASAGVGNIAKMKELAVKGEGLNSFIMKNTRTAYASKLS